MKDEITADPNATDLLGDPLEQRDELIGAPKIEITQQKQLLVAILRAFDWSQDRIARYIKCDPKALRKHYSRELVEAGDLSEGRALEAIVKIMEGDLLVTIGQGRHICGFECSLKALTKRLFQYFRITRLPQNVGSRLMIIIPFPKIRKKPESLKERGAKVLDKCTSDNLKPVNPFRHDLATDLLSHVTPAAT